MFCPDLSDRKIFIGLWNIAHCKELPINRVLVFGNIILNEVFCDFTVLVLYLEIFYATSAKYEYYIKYFGKNKIIVTILYFWSSKKFLVLDYPHFDNDEKNIFRELDMQNFSTALFPNGSRNALESIKE